MTHQLPDCVFSVSPDEFQIFVNGQVLPTTWNSYGAALAGLMKRVERLTVGDYVISPYGDDFWIQHKSGEGMQVFRANFEKLIDEHYRSEF